MEKITISPGSMQTKMEAFDQAPRLSTFEANLTKIVSHREENPAIL
jgi:hypothetical protein